MSRMKRKSRRVYIVFREVVAASSTAFGPDRPIVGATFSEAKALKCEREKNPDSGIHWEAFAVPNGPPGDAVSSVVIAVRKGLWGGKMCTATLPP